MLYSRGTKLAEVPPEARGISWREWERLEDAAARENYAKSLAVGWEPPLSRKHIWTPRDSYGLTGVR
jgi:hypothetical protein